VNIKKASVIDTNGRSSVKKRRVDDSVSDDKLAIVDNNANNDDLKVTNVRAAPARGRGRGRGARSGSSGSTRSAASKRVMPQLDVSITATRQNCAAFYTEFVSKLSAQK